MDSLLNKYPDIVREIIDSKDAYQNILDRLSDVFKDDLLAVFFIENTDLEFKAGVCEGKRIKDIHLDKHIKNKLLYENKITNIVNKYFKKNTISSRLAISGSLFGVFVYSTDKNIDNTKENIINSIASILSYKIKDYELNEVFKIQLKAMQDAINEKNEALETIKKQHKKLKELDKAKNLFLANISHDLRTPLNAIIGFSQALSTNMFGKLNQKQSEYINDIHVSSLHLLGMINEILDISKLEAHAMKINKTTFGANQAINEVVNVLEPLYKNKEIDLKYISKYSGSIKADYQKFQQILYNLLSNAIKFTPKKGKITISTLVKNNNYILKIKDTGIGIDKKYHNKIFKKFTHIDNIYTENSTGLGLTITKELTKLHKGTIILDSEINKGTTFTLEFKDMI